VTTLPPDNPVYTRLAEAGPPSWTRCTHQGHLDDVRLHHEDVGSNPFDQHAQTALWESVGTLLNHLDGLHADDVLVQLVAEGA
jgi:hypothetical protein